MSAARADGQQGNRPSADGRNGSVPTAIARILQNRIQLGEIDTHIEDLRPPETNGRYRRNRFFQGAYACCNLSTTQWVRSSIEEVSIVARFNPDPANDCLLLTIHVGGLGLNLTGADTVVFLEHDWNPTKDLQTIDCAHRLRQKRTVNRYRLITRVTLEEKIISIQSFRTHIANTAVNRDNSSLQSMNTEQRIGQFRIHASDEEESGKLKKAGLSSAGVGKGMKAPLSGLGHLWEEQQYEDEFNVGTFLAYIQQDKAATS